MNLNKITCILIVAVGAFFTAIPGAYAQSPYSMYGFGQLQTGDYGRNAGMAGLSIGIRERGLLNSSNPAALSALDSASFTFDVSLSGKYSHFSSRTKNETTFDGNIQKLAFGFRISPKFASAVGFMPYSNVNYDIHLRKLIEGSPTYEYVDTHFKGSGGLSKFYLSLSYRVLPNLSLGMNSSVIFGSIKHDEDSNGWQAKNKSITSRFYMDFGAQYHTKLSERNLLTIGAVYGYKQKLHFENTFTLDNGDGNTVTEDKQNPNWRSLPAYYGLGASLNLDNSRLTIGADYRYTQTSSLKSTAQELITFQNMHKGTVGLAYIPAKGIYHSYLEIIRYQAGFSISNNYLDMKGSKPTVSFTLGALLPLRTGSVINVAVEYGRLPAAIHEDYFQITIGASFISTWFQKLKYD